MIGSFKNIFLTAERKIYYMEDFNNNVLVCNDPYWRIHEQIRSILININKNPNIQTLFSSHKKFDGFDLNGSYLRFAYSESVSNRVSQDIIPHFEMIYGQCVSFNFFWHFYTPRINEEIASKNPCNLMSMLDAKYLNINNYYISLNSEDRDEHRRFWFDIDSKLSKLGI